MALSRVASACTAVGVVLACTDAMARPTDAVGPWSYDVSELVEFWDVPGDRIRVHYSVAGPNQVRLDDDDDTGIPDMVELVGSVAMDSWELFEMLGFREALPESALGLPPLGGSDALDIYLVDFGGAADGLFAHDACADAPRHCAGHIVMENDFMDYGYRDLNAAITTVVPHELFHGVQAAYDGFGPAWLAEGTAVWAQRVFDPDSKDFLRYGDAYLADHRRTLTKPPPGPVPAFAYGTALWWDFLSERHGTEIIVALMHASERIDAEAIDLPQAMADVVVASGDTLEASWVDFVAANLATGARAGAQDGHPYAAQLAGVTAKTSGSEVVDTERFYPLAATYYRISHGGGPLWLGTSGGGPSFVLTLHPTTDEHRVMMPVDAIVASSATVHPFAGAASLDPGTYWVSGTQARVGDGSIHVDVCVGGEQLARTCADDPRDDETETGTDTEGTRTGGPAQTSTNTGDASATADTSVATSDESGCRCTTPSQERLAWMWTPLVVVVAVKRRQAHGSACPRPPRAPSRTSNTRTHDTLHTSRRSAASR